MQPLAKASPLCTILVAAFFQQQQTQALIDSQELTGRSVRVAGCCSVFCSMSVDTFVMNHRNRTEDEAPSQARRCCRSVDIMNRMITIHSAPVPLRVDESGTIRVGNTRIT